MKLNYKNTMLVGLAFFTISAFWQLYNFIIPKILQYNFNFNQTENGIIMALDNIIAIFMLPLFGMISDKTSTKIGRRTPFIIFGTLAALIFTMGIPYGANTMQLGVFLVALCLVLISMAIYRSPAVALMPDITPKPLRSKGNAVINLMGALGGALILLIYSFMAPDSKHPETANYFPVFIITAGIMVVGTIGLIATIREPKLVKKMRADSAAMGIDPDEAEETDLVIKKKEKLPPELRKSMVLILCSIFLWFMGYNAVEQTFSRYADAINIGGTLAPLIPMVAIVTATIAFIPVAILSSKFGRRKSIMFGIVLLAVSFGTATLYTAYSPLMFVSFGLAGVAWAAINVNSLPMVLEMSKGSNVGKYTGYYYTFSMAAQVVTPVLSGFFLDKFGFSTLMPYGAIFVALAFFTMLFVRHGDSKPIAPASKLESFDTAD